MPVAIVIGISLWGCSSRGSKQSAVEQQTAFMPPAVPLLITDPAERAAYLADHYWEQFDFADTVLVANAEITEQAFVDYLTILPNIPYAKAESSLAALIGSASADTTAFARFVEMAEHYLYDPNSPFRNDEYYIPVLRAVIANEQVDEVSKIRPRYQLEMALKNRPGAIATDFAYVSANGTKHRMSDIRADYTMLLFNNPDCHDCQRVKAFVAASPVMNRMIESKRLAVAAIYPDDDIELWHSTPYPDTWINGQNSSVREHQLYDLKAIPTLYLLDKEKRVVLKDAAVERIEEWLLTYAH